MQKYKRDILIIAIVLAIVLILLASVGYFSRHTTKIRFEDYLDHTVLRVDGQAYTLRELAFYIAFEEQLVEEQAKIYSPENTNNYWNLHTNGVFLRISAQEAAIQMAIHDCIFYELAKKQRLELTAENKAQLEFSRQDFWDNLDAHQQSVLANVKKDLDAAMERMALAQQQQQIMASSSGFDYEDFDVSGGEYDAVLAEHTYEVQSDIWERLDFGNITLIHIEREGIAYVETMERVGKTGGGGIGSKTKVCQRKAC